MNPTAIFIEVALGILTNVAVVSFYFGKINEKLIEHDRRIGDLEILFPRRK